MLGSSNPPHPSTAAFHSYPNQLLGSSNQLFTYSNQLPGKLKQTKSTVSIAGHQQGSERGNFAAIPVAGTNSPAQQLRGILNG